ncbi:uncharacterized protein BXZ73DRAFT_98841 [Epithele typhae]|uniref:uncharacterized protein n=1 Tax=Epithele typhae TaxID=378194 RepID=UPI002008E3A1|nr:uncharacterized protein BXZ73DRAFT_98841 [Epithele typhae]KAH9940405.1 hypothetical protein BXZ73DRAFT_98841 [Epithele typhae]
MASSASGLHIFQDTGAPPGSSDYTTVVVIHGIVWHSAIFSKMVPLARSKNIRLVLVNRQDYPGGAPYNSADRALLPAQAGSSRQTVPLPSENAWVFMQHRASTLNQLLVELVLARGVTPAEPARNKGGIVLAGWSLGVAWITALLTHGGSFQQNGVDLGQYLRRVILYEGSSTVYGYPPSPDPNPQLSVQEQDPLLWLSEYFAHGDTAATLERHTPRGAPTPTLARMTPAEVRATVCAAQTSPGGSDALLLHWGVRTGLFAALRRRALFPPARAAPPWPALEVRVVWGDESVWEVLDATHALRAELADAAAKRAQTRPVTLARVRGANHFAHWDYPEQTLRVFLAAPNEVEA